MNLFQLLPLILVLSLSSTPELGGSSTKVMDRPSSRIRCLEVERKALLKFKDELVDPHGRLSSWGDQENRYECCKWIGVHCHNKTNHVTRLDLNAYPSQDLDDIESSIESYFDYYSPDSPVPLQGTISTSLLELQYLAYLDLSSNDFLGAPIPEFISSLSNLRYLNLASANFSGPIPRHLGNLSKLRYLDLDDLDNPYAESLDWLPNLRALEHLDLSEANLSMATNWLQAVSKLTKLQSLHLEVCDLPDVPSSLLPSVNGSGALAVVDIAINYFSSPLPLLHWFSNFSNSLTFINLRRNEMPCPISDVFENMISLEHLDLSYTGLDCGIPKYLGNMSSLMYLDLTGNNLSGELFDVTMNLTGELEKSLKYLDLSLNNINGYLPNMSRFSLLKVLRLRQNKLNGSIQEGYLHLPYLLFLDLSSNQFMGIMPDLSFSSSLKALLLKENKFNTLADNIGGLSELEVLYIGFNSLKDMITEAHMSNLSRLWGLDLSFLLLKFKPLWVPPFQLKHIILRGCNFGPYFPQWLKTQKQLIHIDISSSGISTVIPSWFGGIASRLEYLNISNNQIHGEFPEISSLSQDSWIDLSNNSISGSTTFLCYNTEWSLLDLSDNMFSGEIPNCFSTFHKLLSLNLASNHFSGEISNLFGSACSLGLLQLRNNSFSEGLPISLSNCIELNVIDLGENRLTGTIPDWLGVRLSKLIALILRSNELNGSIPSSLCRLAHIQTLDLSSNKITGVIPKSIGNFTAMTKTENDDSEFNYGGFLVPSNYVHFVLPFESAYFMWKGKETMYPGKLIGIVKMIDLSNNNLEGEIPSSITTLVGLGGLNISRNNLNGFIPKNIGQLTLLDSLDLSRNRLWGDIPTSLSELNCLGTLNLSYNNLSGRIPRNGHALTFDGTSYIGNDGLCWEPLNKSCPGDEAHHGNPINKEEQDDDDYDDVLITEGFYISIVLGFIVGFWGIFGAILLNKELRYEIFGMLNSFGDFVYLRVELTKARLRRHSPSQ